MTDAITNGVVALGGGFVGGFFAGYAIKKIMKIAAVIVGAFFAALIFMEARGYTTTHWDKVGNDFYHAANATLGNAISGGYNGNVHQVLSTLGIPLTGGLAAGFVLGFIRA